MKQNKSKPLPACSDVLLRKLYCQYIPYFSEIIIEKINESSFNINIDSKKKEDIIKIVLQKYNIIPDKLILTLNKKI